MKLQTAYMGEIDIDPTKMLTFEYGFPGFEDEKQFVLLVLEDTSGFQVLQSVKTQTLAFIVTDPCFITMNYTFDLDEATIHALQITHEKEVTVLSIVSLKDTLATSTVNLKAPIVINTTNNKAKQVILNDERYAIRHPLSLESIKG